MPSVKYFLLVLLAMLIGVGIGEFPPKFWKALNTAPLRSKNDNRTETPIRIIWCGAWIFLLISFRYVLKRYVLTHSNFYHFGSPSKVLHSYLAGTHFLYSPSLTQVPRFPSVLAYGHVLSTFVGSFRLQDFFRRYNLNSFG